MRLLFILLFCSTLLGKEILFYHEQVEDWQLTGGDAAITNESITLKGDASVDLVNRSFQQTPVNTISCYIKHHDHPESPLEMVQASGRKCHCALKIRLGLLELEVGEEWIRVQTLKRDLTVDSILIDTVNSDYEPGKDMFLRFTVEENGMSISLDQMNLELTGTTVANLHDLTLSSYMGTFTVSSFLIESEYENEMVVNEEREFIDIPAQFRPKQFNSMLSLKNHHLVTWEKGRAAGGALLVTPVPDSVVHAGLEAIGAVPGNNLKQESWEKRNDKQAAEPNIHAEGSSLKVTLFSNGKRYDADQILIDDTGGNHHFVFAGNLEFIPVWRSGCVICMQSCPGSKVSNARYTMRDLAKKNHSYSVSKEFLEPGDLVWIRFEKNDLE